VASEVAADQDPRSTAEESPANNKSVTPSVKPEAETKKSALAHRELASDRSATNP